jgi:hypothetical protein
MTTDLFPTPPVAHRSSLDATRNPLLALPSARALPDLPPAARAALRALLMDLKRDSNNRAQKAWTTHKAPMAAYWKAAAV